MLIPRVGMKCLIGRGRDSGSSFAYPIEKGIIIKLEERYYSKEYELEVKIREGFTWLLTIKINKDDSIIATSDDTYSFELIPDTPINLIKVRKVL
jgi:hypothetical protein